MIDFVFSYKLAILFRILTLALIALGIVIQRKSHVNNDSKPEDERKNAMFRPLWHLGFWLYVIFSLIGDFIAISSLPILVIAPLMTIILFFNAIYSWWLLKEKMKRRGWIGTTIIAICSAALAILLNLPNSPKDTDGLT